MRLPRHTQSRYLKQDESGMVLLFWAFSMLGLLGFLAIVADTGLASMERRELQNTADAAAMAGAQDLLLTGGGAEAGAESFAATVHSGLVGNQAVLQDFRVTSNVSANAQSLLDESGPLSFGAPLIGASATARIAAPVWPGSGPFPCAVGASAYSGALGVQDEVTLMCGDSFEVLQPCGLVDISLVVDVTGSVENAGAMPDLVSFAHQFIDTFELSTEAGGLIGITTFGGRSFSVSLISSDAVRLHDMIDQHVVRSTTRTGKGTDLLVALSGGSNQYTAGGVTDRDFAPNVLVIVTDADDTQGHPLSEIVDARNQILAWGEQGLPNGADVIIAVGIGIQIDTVLDAIATGGHVYSTDAWDGLAALMADIAADVCAFADPPVNPVAAAPVNLGNMGTDDFANAALYGSQAPTSGAVTGADQDEYLALLAGLRSRLQQARINDCYTWDEVQPTADGHRCGPFQAAAEHDGKQATTLILVPLAVDADLAAGQITLVQNGDGMYIFAMFWVDAARTFQGGSGACLSGEEAHCNIKGRFLSDVPPYLATPADFTGIELVDWDPASPVGVVQLVD